MGGSVAALNPVAAISSVGSALGQGYFTDKAASRAARGQRQANALNQQMYNEAKAYADPLISGGTDAFSQLLASYGVGGQAPDYNSFYNSPDYQFALQQGQQSLDRQAAAKGSLYSGAQLKAATGFGQGLATQYLGNFRSGLQGLTNTGLNALNSLSGSRENYTQRQTQGYQNLGDIGAARYLGYGNILGNALGGFGGFRGGGGQSSYGSSPPMGTGGVG